ncbi:MAG: hypothetical protein WCX74_02600 [Candidatus Paceibacterota bacterium]
MLDTVILQLHQGQFSILDYKQFKTEKDFVKGQPSAFAKWINNPTAEDKKKSIYKPRLTLNRRGWEQVLRIEFSAPKLVFNNNLEELEEKDFDLVINTLWNRLKEMGVMVYSKDLINAEVLCFHSAKNIKLSNGYTSSFAIRQISKVNIGKRFDIDTKEYRNGGQCLQFYTKVFSMVIYDKVNDYLKPQRRAIDKDQTKRQKDLFEELKKNDPFFEILRIEIRINGKRKINEILPLLGNNKNPCFKDIFKKDLSKKILLHCWEQIFRKNEFLFTLEESPQKIFESLLIKDSKMKVIKAFKITGLYLLSKDEEGITGLRGLVDNYLPKKTNWEVVERYLRALNNKINSPRYSFIDDIGEGLGKFESYKVKKS